MKIKRALKFTAIGLATLLVLSIAGTILIHAYLRRGTEKTVAIHTPNGIEEARFFTIGGIKQWIQIRGEDRNNPVLLFLHGGPGASSLPISSGFRAWERSFTVVQWDQRGAGRTYRENTSAATGALDLARMTADGLELAEEIRRYLHKPKILLVGHSWGSTLGVHMVKARPGIFSAFVGTGQFVDAAENEKFNYARILERAQRANNTQALAELATLGPPPWSEFEQFKTARTWANKLAPPSGDALNPRADFTSPGLSLIDYYYWMKGPAFTRSRFDRSVLSLDLRTLGLEFDVPVFFFHGTEDQFTPIEPVESYFAQIKAPYKELFRFEGDHHFVVFNRPDAFLNLLLTHVVPHAQP